MITARMVDHRGKAAELTTTAGSWLHLFRSYFRAAEKAGQVPALLSANLDEMRRLARDDAQVAAALTKLEGMTMDERRVGHG